MLQELWTQNLPQVGSVVGKTTHPDLVLKFLDAPETISLYLFILV